MLVEDNILNLRIQSTPIQDTNESNPAGVQLDENGGTTGMNNCSDIYLVVGRERAMLIDLSNAIRWDSTASESLRALVAERVGERELFITVTHNHGDHLGMLPAFEEDEKISLWINGAEFEGSDRFPEKRTHYFRECDSLDLGGGFLITNFELPCHTAHSTLFFLKSRDPWRS